MNHQLFLLDVFILVLTITSLHHGGSGYIPRFTICLTAGDEGHTREHTTDPLCELTVQLNLCNPVTLWPTAAS